MRTWLVAAVVALVTLATPATSVAQALHTVFEDDDLSLYAQSDRQLGAFTATLRWLGVDYLRISAEWKIEAPDPQSRRPPPGLAAGDPSAYSTPAMLLLDRTVRAAAAAGLRVMIDPAFSAPLWATSNRRVYGNGDPWYNRNIDVRALAAWESMLARRYSGTYTPPGTANPLPAAAAFTLWNEPNGAAFLAPQWHGRTPVSADWYRRLVYLAYPAIKRVAPAAQVLIGNTSDAGGDPEVAAAGVPPLPFILRLACVDPQLRPVRDGGCARFRTVPGDGFAHHPYERDALPWMPSGPRQAGWLQMGDLPALQTLLDRLVAMRRLAPGVASLWLTEQGYESNAELSDRPWTESQQAQLNAESEYLAWRDPQLRSFSQFLLRDTRVQATLARRRATGDPRAGLAGTWTTGLERDNGRAKAALWMFRSPVVARIASAAHPACLAPGLGPDVATARLVEVWGRARPLRAPSTVQVRIGTSRGSRRLAIPANGGGIFDLTIAAPADPATSISFSWRDPRTGRWQDSPATAAVPIRLPGYRGG